ncbi:MAG: glycosyltransferase [Dehalococcoidales bacterium]|nr:glycosyltransferase [Dehalococcoidales bacterium]
MRVDVHIISWTNTWLDECLRSLENEPIKIHMVDAVIGDLAKARENGFSKGIEKYVAWVDPDDVVIPGTFAKCIEVLEENENCSGVYTTDELIDTNGNHISLGWAHDQKPFTDIGFPVELTDGKHHLRVLKREFVEKCMPLKSKMIPEPILNAEIQNYGPLIHIPIIGYKWRIHGGNTFLKYTKEQLDEAIGYVRNLRPAPNV